jgi:hypothetical protein
MAIHITNIVPDAGLSIINYRVDWGNAVLPGRNKLAKFVCGIMYYGWDSLVLQTASRHAIPTRPPVGQKGGTEVG